MKIRKIARNNVRMSKVINLNLAETNRFSIE